jgi:hypothetical protein
MLPGWDMSDLVSAAAVVSLAATSTFVHNAHRGVEQVDTYWRYVKGPIRDDCDTMSILPFTRPLETEEALMTFRTHNPGRVVPKMNRLTPKMN